MIVYVLKFIIFIVCIAGGVILIDFLPRSMDLESPIEIFLKYIKRRKEIKKWSNFINDAYIDCEIRIKINQILDLSLKKAKPEDIIFEVAKTTKGRRNSIIPTKVNIYEGEMAVEKNITISLPEKFVISYVNQKEKVAQGVNIKCNKLCINSDKQEDYYIVYFTSLSKEQLMHLAELAYEYDTNTKEISLQTIEAHLSLISGTADIILLHKKKDKDIIVKEHMSSVKINTQKSISSISKKVNSALGRNHEPIKNPQLQSEIDAIDKRIQSGNKIKGISETQWKIYRDEIRDLLKRDLTEKQQRAIKELLSKISESIFSPDSEKQRMDTDVTIEALNQLFNISSY